MALSILHPFMQAWRPARLIKDFKSLSDSAFIRYFIQVATLSILTLALDPSWANFKISFIILTHVFLLGERRLTCFAWGFVGSILYVSMLAASELWLAVVASTLVFIVPNAIGVWFWLPHIRKGRVRIQNKEDISPGKKVIADVILGLTLIIAMVAQYNDLIPAATGFSLIAAALSIIRLKDQWWVWGMVSLANIGLWLGDTGRPDNIFFAGFYVIMFFQSVVGYRLWNRYEPLPKKD